MKTTNIFLCLLALVLASCDEIFEKNISDYCLKLLSPKDNYSTSDASITFRWELVDNANYYNLIIGTPELSEDGLSIILIDTTISQTTFTIELPNNNSYEWGVKAINGISETPYTYRKLYIYGDDNRSSK